MAATYVHTNVIELGWKDETQAEECVKGSSRLSLLFWVISSWLTLTLTLHVPVTGSAGLPAAPPQLTHTHTHRVDL